MTSSVPFPSTANNNNSSSSNNNNSNSMSMNDDAKSTSLHNLTYSLNKHQKQQQQLQDQDIHIDRHGNDTTRDEKLDQLLIEYLELLEHIRHLRVGQLHRYVRTGIWELTELKYSNNASATATSSSSLLTSNLLSREAYEHRTNMEAQVHIEIHHNEDGSQEDDDDIETHMSVVNRLSDDGKHHDGSDKMSAQLRHRLHSKQDNDEKDPNERKHSDDQYTDNDNDKQRSISLSTSSSNNPLQWFQSLRINNSKLQDTQKHFISAVESAVDIANSMLKMRRIEKQYQLLTQKSLS